MTDERESAATVDWRRSVATWTVVIFGVTGSIVALSQWGLFPRQSLVVGAPAIIVVLLVDTFLYNEFLIETGRGFWILLAGALFVQSTVVAVLASWTLRVAARWWRRRSGADSRQ